MTNTMKTDGSKCGCAFEEELLRTVGGAEACEVTEEVTVCVSQKLPRTTAVPLTGICAEDSRCTTAIRAHSRSLSHHAQYAEME